VIALLPGFGDPGRHDGWAGSLVESLFVASDLLDELCSDVVRFPLPWRGLRCGVTVKFGKTTFDESSALRERAPLRPDFAI
jgi:hypothetical protein